MSIQPRACFAEHLDRWLRPNSRQYPPRAEACNDEPKSWCVQQHQEDGVVALAFRIVVTMPTVQSISKASVENWQYRHQVCEQ